MKRIFLFLSLCLIINFTKAQIIASGTCGKSGSNVTWTLDDAYCLTLEGSGEMADYSSDESTPWYNRYIKRCIISEGITNIGKYAFSGCNNIVDVTIPGSVKSIGEDAFHGCQSLTSITIPSSVTSIGDGAFQYCI